MSMRFKRIVAVIVMQDNVKSQSLYRMSKESFNILVEKVRPAMKNEMHVSVGLYVRVKGR